MVTFVVRVWIPVEPEPDAPLRGTVERVGTGTSEPFAHGDELLAFLSAEVGAQG